MSCTKGRSIVALAIALMAAASLAASAAGSTWKVTELSDDQVDGPLFGVSCPTTSFCVVGGSDTLIATSTDPTGGRSAWKVFHPGGAESLPSPPPGMPPGSGGVIFPGAQVRGVSCPSTGLCVAVTFDGRILSSTNPTGGAGAWKVTPLSGPKEPNTHMTGVSCPTSGLCIAAAYGSKVVHSSSPTGDASAWTTTQLATPVDLRGISCPTPSFCAAVDNEGAVVVSTNPTGPASAWSLVGRPAGLGHLNGIACPSPALCVTGNPGQMISSTNPAGGIGSWRAVAAGTGLPLKGFSCPSVVACAAVDNNSDVLVSTNPTGGGEAWTFTNVIPAPSTPSGGQNGMFGISCPRATLCVAVGAREQIITSTDPFVRERPRSAGSRGGLRVVITRHPAKRIGPRKKGVRVTFGFRAIGGPARFRCKLAGGAKKGRKSRRRPSFRSCRSPIRYRVGSGKHVFRVRAVAADGRRSRPVAFHFRVGRLIERSPAGSCRRRPDGLPPGVDLEPCVNARAR